MMFNRVVSTLLQLVAPPYCSFCRIPLDARQPLCAACLMKIRPVSTKELQLTFTKKMKVFAASEYEDPLRSLILAKNHGSLIASHQLGILATRLVNCEAFECDMIVPIPLHWTRYAHRGFNQAEVIAKCIAKRVRRPLVPLLKRTRRTVFQYALHPTRRHENVKDVFQVTASDIEGKRILLVDDLMTTGATLTEAGVALLSYKPCDIFAVVACRTL